MRNINVLLHYFNPLSNKIKVIMKNIDYLREWRERMEEGKWGAVYRRQTGLWPVGRLPLKATTYSTRG
jgi:hypothetical protein